MNGILAIQRLTAVVLALIIPFAVTACGDDDGTGPGDDATGARLEGRVVVFDLGQASVRHHFLSSLDEPGVTVAVGSKSTITDADGRFLLEDIPIGDQVLGFSRDGATRTYLLSDVDRGEAFELDSIELRMDGISTQHTGTWEGTAGSVEPGSQGPIALTMILEKNGNVITGTATGGPPDNSTWSLEGTETGLAMEADFDLVSSADSCATGGELSGTFDADTLAGTFIEVNPPAGCGITPESGLFRVVKQ